MEAFRCVLCLLLMSCSSLTKGDEEQCSFTVNIPVPNCTKQAVQVEELEKRLKMLTQQIDELIEKYERSALVLTGSELLQDLTLLECNFDDHECPQLINDVANEIDWKLHSNSTPTEFTGPVTGAGGSASYIYFESSSDITSDSGRLVTPILGANGSTCVEFFYHMYGEDIRSLVLLTREGEVLGSKDVVLWSEMDPQGHTWIKYRHTHDMNINQRLVWQAFNGRYEKGDIALDSIKITKGTCSPVAEEMTSYQKENAMPSGKEVTPTGSGSMYIRWGRTTCPNDSSILYTGFAAGGHFDHLGSTANYLCLPSDPDFALPLPGFQGQAYVFQARYGTKEEDGFIRDHSKELHDRNVPCTACHVQGRDLVNTFPGWLYCPDKWTTEYRGYLMTERSHYANNKVPVCMDEAPEVMEYIPDANARGALFRNMEVVCDDANATSFCDTYNNGHELTCVVCSL